MGNFRDAEGNLRHSESNKIIERAKPKPNVGKKPIVQKPADVRKQERQKFMEDFRAGADMGKEFVPTGSLGRLDLQDKLQEVSTSQRNREIQAIREQQRASMRDLMLAQGKGGVQGGSASAGRANLLAAAGQDISRVVSEGAERDIARKVGLEREEEVFNIGQENKERFAQLSGGTFLSQLASAERTSSEAAKLQSEATAASSSGGKVICTELHRQGYMSDNIFILDQVYGQLIAFNNPELMRNYHRVAKHVVQAMRRSKKLTKFIAFLVNSWARHMASQILPNKHTGSLLGKLIHKIGEACLK